MKDTIRVAIALPVALITSLGTYFLLIFLYYTVTSLTIGPDTLPFTPFALLLGAIGSLVGVLTLQTLFDD